MESPLSRLRRSAGRGPGRGTHVLEDHPVDQPGVLLEIHQPVAVDPEDFAELVEKAHGLGMAVILDMVFNHVGSGSSLDKLENLDEVQQAFKAFFRKHAPHRTF